MADDKPARRPRTKPDGTPYASKRPRDTKHSPLPSVVVETPVEPILPLGQTASTSEGRYAKRYVNIAGMVARANQPVVRVSIFPEEGFDSAPEQKFELGRPTEYRPEFAALLVEMSALGYGLSGFCAYLKVSRRGIAGWRQRHEEFAQAVALGTELRQAWFEAAGQRGMFTDPKKERFDGRFAEFMMKNAFPHEYGDRLEIAHRHSRDDEAEVDRNQLMRELLMAFAEPAPAVPRRELAEDAEVVSEVVQPPSHEQSDD